MQTILSRSWFLTILSTFIKRNLARAIRTSYNENLIKSGQNFQWIIWRLLVQISIDQRPEFDQEITNIDSIW